VRIVYLGTPDFAVNPLKAIVEKGKDEVVAVVCNNDKPVGRKQILTFPPVKVYALEHNIPVYQYQKIRNEGVEDLKALAPDLMVTCAFGQILSQEIIDIPKIAVINIHASLLPKYRGASPINYAILNGETKSGITIMRTDVGIDTGDILMQKEIDINGNNYGELSDRLSILGSDCILTALDLIRENKAVFTRQNNDGATYTKMIKKEDAMLDFSLSPKEVENKIKAYNPAPVAFTFLNGEPFKIYVAKTTSIKTDKSAGTIVVDNNKLYVACKNELLELITIQKAGGKQINACDFLRGNKVDGLVLGK